MTDDVKVDLPALRRLAAKATAGPWEYDPDPGDEPPTIHAYYERAGMLPIATMDDQKNGADDARFIIALRNQFPALDAALTQAAEALRATPCPRADFPGDTCGFWAETYGQERCLRCAALRALGMDNAE